MKKLWTSLRGRLAIVPLIALIGMITIVAVSFYSFWRLTQEQVYAKFESIRESVESHVRRGVEELNRVAWQTGYSSDVQAYLISPNPVSTTLSHPRASETLRNVMSMTDYSVNVYLLSDFGRRMSEPNIYQSYFTDVMGKYGLTDFKQITEPFYSDIFLIKERDNSPHIFYFFPVDDKIICAVLCDLGKLIGWNSLEYQNLTSVILYRNQIISRDNSFGDREQYELQNVSEGSGVAVIGGERYLTNSIEAEAFLCRFVFLAKESDVLSGTNATRNLGLAVTAVSGALMVAIIALIMFSIHREVRQISNDSERIGATDKNVRMRPAQMMELEGISFAINRMLDRIEDSARQENEMQERLFDAKIAQNRAEITAYRNQINPHFLFNTLECMRSLADFYKAEPVIRLVSSMAVLFRYSIYSKMYVSLREEEKHVKNYLKVMEIRYPERFKYDFQISGEAMERHILSMVLQPIVENSIFHGFVEKQLDCHIKISANVDTGKNLIIQVQDNGAGITPSRLAELEKIIRSSKETDSVSKKNHIGLANIYRRLSITFGDRFDMFIRSQVGKYTVVELNIPPVPLTEFEQKHGQTDA